MLSDAWLVETEVELTELLVVVVLLSCDVLVELLELLVELALLSTCDVLVVPNVRGAFGSTVSVAAWTAVGSRVPATVPIPIIAVITPSPLR